MRRKHKLFYEVTDWSNHSGYYWWCHKQWTNDSNLSKKYGASSNKDCRTFRQACRHAGKLTRLGRDALIVQYMWRKGHRYCREYLFYAKK
jgi:hypothetical protein